MRTLLYICFFIHLFSCGGSEFVDLRYPILETHPATDIDENGATLNAVILETSNQKIVEYGFEIFASEVDPLNSTIIEVGKGLSDKNFSIRLQDRLVKDLQYFVRAYIKTQALTIRGNLVEFNSKGSKDSPWAVINRYDTNEYGANTLKVNEGIVYVLSQGKEFYELNLQSNQVKVLPEPNTLGNSLGSDLASFILSDTIYFYHNSNNGQLFKYNYNSMQWSAPSDLTIGGELRGDVHGFSYQNVGYLLTEDSLFEFDNKNNKWNKLHSFSPVDVTKIHHAQSSAYVFLKNHELWNFDFINNVWTLVTKFPGDKEGPIISFLINDKIYAGLSYSKRDFWQYSTDTDEWVEIESFPLPNSGSNRKLFEANSKGYFGFAFGFRRSILFSFDPSRIPN